MTRTNFYTIVSNTIKDLLAKFDDKHAKQDTNFKETIADQDEKFYARSVKQLYTLSLHTKEYSTKFSLKLDDQEKNPSFTTSYN